MLILSQDKEKIVNFDNVESIGMIEFASYISIKAKMQDAYIGLGNYKDLERAKEVLRNINSAYINNEMLKMSKVTIREDISMFKLAENICFAMPEE